MLFRSQLLALNKNALVLRIRMPIGGAHHPRDFITKITRYPRICSIPNSMTVLPTFFPHIHKWMLQKQTGVINCTNPGTISHNEILQLYKERIIPDLHWVNMSLEEQKHMLAAGRSNNTLNTERLENLAPGIPTIKEALNQIIDEYNRGALWQCPVCRKEVKSSLTCTCHA